MAIDFAPPIHPGAILREEFLEPLDMSAGQLAKALDVPRSRIERLVKETHPVTPDTALRLSQALGTTAQLWMNMQARYDLTVAMQASRASIQSIQMVEGLANDNYVDQVERA